MRGPKGIHSRIALNLRVLGSFSWREQVTWIVGRINPLWRGRDYSRIAYEKRFFDRIIGGGGSITRIPEGRNLIVVRSDNDLGPYRLMVRRGDSDLAVFDEVLFRKEYKSIVMAAEAIVDRNGLINIVDAGANIGMTTLFFKRCFPRARIVAIEPEITNFRLLEAMICLNEMEGVIPLQAALWDSSSSLKCVRTKSDETAWAVQVEECDKEMVALDQLNGITLVDVARRFGMENIDILKLDIEGAEDRVLSHEGSHEVLSKTKFIVMEIHDKIVIRSRIFKLLDEAGFNVEERGLSVLCSNRAMMSTSIARRE
jgi:FkbM family methyltransferase